MKVRNILLVPLIVAAWSAVAQGQVIYDTEMVSLSVVDGTSSGMFQVDAYFTVSGEPSSVPLDLSTEAVVLVNGLEQATATIVLLLLPSASCIDGAPCGGSCGSIDVNGDINTMTCHQDGPCNGGLCDCNCGYWVQADLGEVPLRPHDEIMILLRPAPGALPDPDPSNNAIVLTFNGQPIGWNRSVDEISVFETEPGTYEVVARGSVGWEAQPGFLNLDLEVELTVNGLPIASQNVPAQVDGIFDQTCFQNGCGNTCGTINGIPRTCDPYLWWDCGCVGGWLAPFPGVELLPGDVIEVILRPVPGALPELPGFPEEDDSLDIVCCDAEVGVGDAATGPAPWQLSQNRPNPFNPMTTIGFTLEEHSRVRLDVYDAQGRHLATLADRSFGIGPWSVTWDGRTKTGAAVPSGSYFYRLSVNGVTETRKMTLLK